MKKSKIAALTLIALLCLLSACGATAETALKLSGEGTVTISDGGTYHISGTLNGQLLLNVPDKRVDLVFYGVSITNPDGPCILVEDADEVTIHLEKGSENTLISGTACDVLVAPVPEDTEGAAVWAKCDLNIKGSGSLFVGGYIHHGIQSVGDLKVKNGNITVEAIAQALRGRDSVTISGGKLKLTAGADAIHVAKVKKAGKGFILMEGGKVSIHCNDDGMQAASDLTVTGGTLAISAADKAFKAEGSITIGEGCTCTWEADGQEQSIRLTTADELPEGTITLKFDKK